MFGHVTIGVDAPWPVAAATRGPPVHVPMMGCGSDYFGAYLRDPNGDKLHIICRGVKEQGLVLPTD
ncbi:hypothetical protein C7453_102367 [Gluconacetobacter liquefaciens]|uniref:Uncharacterized protein n=1 Tax=Gluconacetobacter liquefaciens TaxID=89584 RepID=A0A370G8W1_GLULI|nr:hypothetical protein C7453_102367 [Gluconacetobacter liquefaciens]